MFDWLKHFIDGIIHQTPVQRLAVLHGAMQDAAAAAQVLATPEVMSILPPEAQATILAVKTTADAVEALHKTVQAAIPAAAPAVAEVVLDAVQKAEEQATADAKAAADAEAAKLAAEAATAAEAAAKPAGA